MPNKPCNIMIKSPIKFIYYRYGVICNECCIGGFDQPIPVDIPKGRTLPTPTRAQCIQVLNNNIQEKANFCHTLGYKIIFIIFL